MRAKMKMKKKDERWKKKIAMRFGGWAHLAGVDTQMISELSLTIESFCASFKDAHERSTAPFVHLLAGKKGRKFYKLSL